MMARSSRVRTCGRRSQRERLLPAGGEQFRFFERPRPLEPVFPGSLIGRERPRLPWHARVPPLQLPSGGVAGRRTVVAIVLRLRDPAASRRQCPFEDLVSPQVRVPPQQGLAESRSRRSGLCPSPAGVKPRRRVSLGPGVILRLPLPTSSNSRLSPAHAAQNTTSPPTPSPCQCQRSARPPSIRSPHWAHRERDAPSAHVDEPSAPLEVLPSMQCRSRCAVGPKQAGPRRGGRRPAPRTAGDVYRGRTT